MPSEKLTFPDFEIKLVNIFGKPLNEKAKLAAIDFWNYWDDLKNGIKNNIINMNVDMLFLGMHSPKYKTYQVWNGLSIILIIVSLILFFISWKTALVFVVIALLSRYYGNVVKLRNGLSFIQELKSMLINNEPDGMISLCADYIGGTIKLKSSNGYAHWPLYPSCVIIGENKLIV